MSSSRVAQVELQPEREPRSAVLMLMQGTEQQEIKLEKLPFTIGRKKECDLLLSEAHISRDHAQIVLEADGFYLVDVGSKHGSYVNGERIERRKLKPNDRMEFGVPGNACLVFNSYEQKSSSARDFLSQVVAVPGRSDLEMLTIFLEAARKLNTAGVVHDVLLTLIDTTLKLTRAERGYVYIRDASGVLRMAAGQTSKGERLIDDRTISRSLLEEAANAASEFLIQDTRDSSQFAARGSIVANELRTIICIPLRKHKMGAKKESAEEAATAAGVLYLDSRFVASDISSTNHDLLRAISSEAAALLENAQLVQAEEEARKVQQELRIASYIQQQLMAVRIPELGFASLQAKNVACKDIGGDFYDVVMTGEGLAVATADVCGKGISAALLAAILQGMIHSMLTNNVPLTEIAVTINDFLCQKDLDAKYATLILMRLRCDGFLEYVNCGHVPPLLLRQGNTSRLEAGNFPVGLMPGAAYESSSVQLRAGDKFLMVTDGITEAQNEAGDFFGDARLQTAATSDAPFETIYRIVSEFCDGHPFDDDCTVVNVAYKG